jgi:predicted dehydrogenase
MAATLNWGIIGAGHAAHRFARDLRRAAGARLEAVAARDGARAAAMAARVGARRAYTGYEALLADSAVDVVYVGTGTASHAEHARLSIEAGNPTLVEKPLAASAEGAIALAELAAAKGVFLMEAMWMRFTPAMAEVRRAVGAGEIGEVRALQADLGFAAAPDPTDWRFDPARGGGALLDLGVYPLSLAIDLLGPASSVGGAVSYGVGGVDVAAGIALGHANGLSQLGCSLVTTGRNEAVVVGERGRLRLCAPFFCAPRLVRTRVPAPAPRPAGGEADFSPKRLEAVRMLLKPLDLRRQRTRLTLFAGTGLQYQAQEAMRCIAAGWSESPLMPLAHSVEVLRIVDESKRGANVYAASGEAASPAGALRCT